MKKLTAFSALVVLSLMMVYSSVIAGTLIHELTHIRNSVQPKAIVVEYDGDGEATALEFPNDSEIYATFNGAIVTTCLMLIGQIAMLIVIKYDGRT
jgi:hypothetical protein